MFTIDVTDKERDLLLDLMNAWEDGMDLAVEEFTKDPVLSTFEDMLELTSDVEEDRCLLRSVKAKLKSAPNTNTA